MTEREKQLRGEWFRYNDPGLKALRAHCNKEIFRLNSLDNSRKEERLKIIKGLFGSAGENVNIKSYFQCDYGYNIYAGDNVFANYNCVFLDVGRIEIGADTLIGPQVGIYTAAHPLGPELRRSGVERAEDVRIGKNCWIGGNVTINPGVVLGDNVVVASGAVVTQSFEGNVMIAGVPARVIKKL